MTLVATIYTLLRRFFLAHIFGTHRGYVMDWQAVITVESVRRNGFKPILKVPESALGHHQIKNLNDIDG